MELRSGYKQTEVGVIPEEWEVKRLGDLATIRDGTHQTPKYVASGVPFYSVEHVTSGDFTRTKFISEQEHRFLTRSVKIESGDILMTRIGSIGDCKLIDWDVDASFYVSLALLKVRGALPKFIAQYSNSAAFKAEIELNSLLSAIPKKINLGPISDIRLSIPPLPEQRAIAAALSDLDALIAGLDQLIAKKRDLKKAAMQQLLTGQTRLPGFSAEWTMTRLGDMAEIVSGSTPKTGISAYWNGGIKWCTPTDITGTTGKYLSETARTISSLGLVSCSARILPVGALLLCSRATIGEIKIAVGPICTNQGFKSLICNRDTNNEFLYYKLLTMKNQMIERAIGSTFLEISKKDTAMLEVKVPSLDEQTAIAAVLSDMDFDLAALESRHDKTRDLKQGMMQELLTGRIRLI